MKRILPVFALLILTGAARADVAGDQPAPTLTVGDPAPALQGSTWVQGEPVEEFKKGTAYIVEFWATWCGPCRAHIPHLNEIHLKYKNKGLVVIGQDVFEQEQDAVLPFIKQMQERMTYRVVLDDMGNGGKGKMAVAWMEAAQQREIPTTFVVDKSGKIAWIGNPVSLQEAMLEQVLAGTFDIKRAAADFKLKMQTQSQLEPLWQAFYKWFKDKEWDKADATLNSIEKLMLEDQREHRYRLNASRYEVRLRQKDYPDAFKIAARISDDFWDDAELQQSLASDIATRKGIEARDLELAEKFARRANDLAKGKDASILDTLARVLFMKGQKAAAIAIEEKAVAAAEDKELKNKFQKSLDSYTAGNVPAEE